MRLHIDNRIQKTLGVTNYEEGESDIIRITISQLSEYFRGGRTSFDIPLKLVGTDFQQSVWHQLMQVPYGETYSYLQLSRLIGNEKAIRAVASANAANAISIIVPCHRIVGSNGKLVGYSGGAEAKRKLLQLENARIANSQLRLF